MELCAVGQLTVNYKVISIFKKDFWKVFLGKIEDKSLSSKANGIISINEEDADRHVSRQVSAVPAVPVLKKRLLKIKPAKSYDESTIFFLKNVDDDRPLDEKQKKRFKNITKRFIKNTPANRKKLDRSKTLKRGGKYKNTTIKSGKNNKCKTMKSR